MNKSNAANVLLLTEPGGKVNYPPEFLCTTSRPIAHASEGVFLHSLDDFPRNFVDLLVETVHWRVKHDLIEPSAFKRLQLLD
jgi:hypothetical protein